jgi:L-lactate dehydrogenase complex protein LldG
LEEAPMNERDKILARVREALKVRAPAPGHAEHSGARPASDGKPDVALIRQWLPKVDGTVEQRLKLLRDNLAGLKAEFRLVNDLEELWRCLSEMKERDGWKKVASHSGDLTDVACRVLALPVCLTDKPYDVRELERCDAGITECDALVAQTGSVLVTSRSAGGRALSVLPPHHIVLARQSQLVGDLSEAFELLKSKYANDYPSLISFITGPSRTGDIERILVLGAHGPKKLTVFCLTEIREPSAPIKTSPCD